MRSGPRTPARGRTPTCCGALDGRTVQESLTAGEDPKVVWRAVWAELGLPVHDR